jgi:hypothetical protein
VAREFLQVCVIVQAINSMPSVYVAVHVQWTPMEMAHATM